MTRAQEILTPHPGHRDTIQRLREALQDQLSTWSDLEVELLWGHFSETRYAASFLGDPSADLIREFSRWIEEPV